MYILEDQGIVIERQFNRQRFLALNFKDTKTCKTIDILKSLEKAELEIISGRVQDDHDMIARLDSPH
jgi:hypothetical protein